MVAGGPQVTEKHVELSDVGRTGFADMNARYTVSEDVGEEERHNTT